MKIASATLSVGILWLLAAVVQSQPSAVESDSGEKYIVVEDVLVLRKKRNAEKPITIEDVIFRKKREAGNIVIEDEVMARAAKNKPGKRSIIIEDNILKNTRDTEKSIVTEDHVLKKRDAGLAGFVPANWGQAEKKPDGIIEDILIGRQKRETPFIVIEDDMIMKKKQDPKPPIVIEDIIMQKTKRQAQPIVIEEDIMMNMKQDSKPLIVNDDIVMLKKREAKSLSPSEKSWSFPLNSIVPDPPIVIEDVIMKKRDTELPGQRKQYVHDSCPKCKLGAQSSSLASYDLEDMLSRNKRGYLWNNGRK